MTPFDPHLLERLCDVADGVDVETAKLTLAALGFQHLEPENAAQQSYTGPALRAHAWVHPSGILIGGVEGQKTLNSIRMGAVLSLGWKPMEYQSGTLNLTRGEQWRGEDAQSYIQANTPLQGDASLFSHLRSLHSSHARIMPFAEWAGRARKGGTRFWLFVFGNEVLQAMSETMDVPAWIGQADRSLAIFIQDRIERLGKSDIGQPISIKGQPNTVTKDISARDAERLQHVFNVSERLNIERPTKAQTKKIKKWLTTPGGEWKPDYDFLHGGLNQGSLMAIGAVDRKSQEAMLRWIERAPAHMLERVLLVADETGHNLTSLLLKSMVHFCDVEARCKAADMGAFTARCLGIITARVGSLVMEQALHLDGTPIGQVLGFRTDVTNRNLRKDRLSQHCLRVLDFMDEAGIPHDPMTVLASFQPPLVLDINGERQETRVIGGAEQQQLLAKGPSPGPADWGIVLAKRASMAMHADTKQTQDDTRPALRF